MKIKRWTARRKSAMVLEIIQGKATVTVASRPLASDTIALNNGGYWPVCAVLDRVRG